MKTESHSGWNGTMTPASFLGGFLKKFDLLVESTPNRIESRAYMPQVSILCTSKGALYDHILQCCYSLSTQQDFNFELIVACRSRWDFNQWNEVLKNFEFQAHVFLTLESKNRSQAFKAAFEACRSPWCYVLDADDMLQENAVPYTHWVLSRMPQFRVFCSNHAQTDEQGDVFVISNYDPHEQRPEALALGFKQRHLWGFHRDVLKTIPNLLDSPYLCEDMWVFSRLAMHSEPVLHIPKTLYLWRRHPLQLTQVLAEDISRMCKEIQIEMHRWMCSRPNSASFADELMAERIRRTAKNLLE